MSNVSASKFTATGSGFVMYTSTNPPTNPVLGQYYYNTADNYIYIWNGSGWAKMSNKLSASTFTTKTSFTYTGVDQLFTVPTGISRIKVKCWGAAGGGSSSSNTDRGGSGGYSYGELDVSSGQQFVIVVGQGGRNTNGRSPATYGGGGEGTWDGSSHRSGSGGGLSGIFEGSGQVFSGASPQSGAHSRSIIIAGGGGGANDQTSDSSSAVQAFYNGAAGGSGGGFIGQTGNTNNTNPGGTGGTQTAGGTNSGGNSGSALRGGNSPGGNSDNPGGGGGYFGGASGDADANGAGGGSGYIGGTSQFPVENGAYFTGNYNLLAPQATADTDYVTGIGVGTSGGNAQGGNGLVVISY